MQRINFNDIHCAHDRLATMYMYSMYLDNVGTSQWKLTRCIPSEIWDDVIIFSSCDFPLPDMYSENHWLKDSHVLFDPALITVVSHDSQWVPGGGRKWRSHKHSTQDVFRVFQVGWPEVSPTSIYHWHLHQVSFWLVDFNDPRSWWGLEGWLWWADRQVLPEGNPPVRNGSEC